MIGVTRSALTAANGFLEFVDASPSPYHAVEECKKRLIHAGFQQLKEDSKWEISPMGRYFLTRNQSNIIAFTVGANWKPGNGFTMFGAHTDSPCLRIKVNSKRENNNFVQVGTECYGGGNWLSWFDRDLRMAGRLLVREENDTICSKLIHINKPIMRVPHLAIHLQREMNDRFSVNKETDLVPILSNSVGKELLASSVSDPLSSCMWKHHKHLIDLLVNEAAISPKNLVDFDLFLADHQPSAIGGVKNEFIFAPRLDNLLSTYTGLLGLIKSCDSLQHESNIRMFLSFDNEEVGSQSAQGAASSHVEYILRRLSSGSNPLAFEEAMPKSMVLSADMAHACHPNYSSKHEENMRPTLYGGPVIKTNNNTRYATTAVTATIVREAAKHANVPLQDVMVRNDSPCGSTIGPIMSAKLGVQTADIGAAQLSMHSIREVCGTVAIEQCENLYKSYFETYSTINSKMMVD